MLFSGKDQDILKVLKMDQDNCQSALEQAKELNTEADAGISDTDRFIAETERKHGIDSSVAIPPQISTSPKPIVSEIVVSEWEALVGEAQEAYPEEILINDILTQEEYQNAMRHLNEINIEFSKKTSIINKTDIAFLMVATALQVTKTLLFPYFAEKKGYGDSFNPDDRKKHNDPDIKKEERDKKDKYKDKKSKKNKEGHWINILYQKVPYDATAGSPDIGINLHGGYHRLYTLGHDPILGWIFGTANILTDCITLNTFQTNRVSRVDPVTGAKELRITPEIVPLSKMFKESYDCAKAHKLNLPAAITAQRIHLKSDEFTKLGLPIPILSIIDETFASKLYSENYDALCFSRDLKIVGASFAVSKIIDIIIALVHGLFRKEEEDKDLYEVRTRKILLISNSIAGTSTVINALITKNPKKLDIGGLLNTISHLFTDIRFITRIKQEFVESQLDFHFKGITDEIEEMNRILLSN